MGGTAVAVQGAAPFSILAHVHRSSARAAHSTAYPGPSARQRFAKSNRTRKRITQECPWHQEQLETDVSYTDTCSALVPLLVQASFWFVIFCDVYRVMCFR